MYLGSITPGHPENFVTPGVEVSTGPLGQGISNAVGLAIAEKHLSAVYNRDEFNIVDHYTYVICGDGCLQEGISSEACSLAGHLGLGKLIVCYDDNHITIDGDTKLSFTEDVNMRYQSYGWHVQTVDDVNNLDSLREAINNAKQEVDRPSIIKIRTVIGQGSGKEGKHDVHGAPLGAADLANVKTKFGFNPAESFAVPTDVYDHYRSRGNNGPCEEAWNKLFAAYTAKYPELAVEYNRIMKNEMIPNWKSQLPVYSHTDNKAVATRSRSEEVLNCIAKIYPEIIGGSADLTPSNLTSLKCSSDFQKATPAGRYIRFGVREHGMAAICNGIFAHGGLKPYCATFLNFIGYALGSVRLSALSRFGVIYVMTHDSIGLGEDGPTHQPVEMMECLRAIPNLLTFRPADGNEVVGAYVAALENHGSPSVISLSRQGTPTLEHSSAEKVAYGAYTVFSTSTDTSKKVDIVLVSTGTEVNLSIQTAKKMHEENNNVSVRVVSMPCWELFDKQSHAYKLEIFPVDTPVMSIEAAGVQGWKTYAHCSFGLNSYGASAPAGDLYNHFGFTVPNLSARAKEVIAYFKGSAPSLLSFPSFPSIAPPHGGHH